MRQLTATKWQMTAQRSNIAGILCLCHSAQFSKNEKPAVSNIETTSWCRIVSAAREKDDHIWAFLCQHKSSGRSKWCGWYHGKCYTNCTHVIAIANLEKTSASDFALSILTDSDVHVVVNPEPHPKASKPPPTRSLVLDTNNECHTGNYESRARCKHNMENWSTQSFRKGMFCYRQHWRGQDDK